MVVVAADVADADVEGAPADVAATGSADCVALGMGCGGLSFDPDVQPKTAKIDGSSKVAKLGESRRTGTMGRIWPERDSSWARGQGNGEGSLKKARERRRHPVPLCLAFPTRMD